jgi:hypothetical protein
MATGVTPRSATTSTSLRTQFPALAVMGLRATEEVAAFAEVPHSYGRKIVVTNTT